MAVIASSSFFRFDYETALIRRLYEEIRDDDGEEK